MPEMTKKKSKVVWCDRGWFPAYFGFCPSKKAWDREMKRLGKTRGVGINDFNR